MKKIVATDFDGTLTSKDTLLEFIRFAKGDMLCIFGFLLYSPLILLMRMKLYPNYRSKQKVFSFFFKGMPLEEFNRLGHEFADSRQYILRSGAKQMLKVCKENGTEVVVVSASIDNWVQPFFPDLKVLGTQVEVVEGKLTGRFLSKNCYGQEKINRLLEIFPDREKYYLIAYGDSNGDRKLLDFADESYYKPFR